ncbi:hypothetical protein POKO110462_17275 [Pontibacter korlensis]
MAEQFSPSVILFYTLIIKSILTKQPYSTFILEAGQPFFYFSSAIASNTKNERPGKLLLYQRDYLVLYIITLRFTKGKIITPVGSLKRRWISVL